MQMRRLGDRKRQIKRLGTRFLYTSCSRKQMDEHDTLCYTQPRSPNGPERKDTEDLAPSGNVPLVLESSLLWPRVCLGLCFMCIHHRQQRSMAAIPHSRQLIAGNSLGSSGYHGGKQCNLGPEDVPMSHRLPSWRPEAWRRKSQCQGSFTRNRLKGRMWRTD